MKLSRLLEDRDLVLGGTKEFAGATEKEVLQKHTQSAVGTGVKPPQKGNPGSFVEVGSPSYISDTLVPSKIHRKGQEPKVDKLSI
jgi:hypothetical protein